MNKIGIIGAMELEVAALKEKMQIAGITEKAGMEFYEGTLENSPVVVVKCGIGKVNAAMCVQILADLYHVTHILNTGVAGSLNPNLDIGDILVSREAIQHDMDVTVFGYAPGQVPGTKTPYFTADPLMCETAKTACLTVNPDINVMKGRVVSGDQFISRRDVKERLVSVFNGDCAEMEGASIAQAATLNELPFVIIRAISDKADDSAEMDYPSFERQAAGHCARMVLQFLKTF